MIQSASTERRASFFVSFFLIIVGFLILSLVGGLDKSESQS